MSAPMSTLVTDLSYAIAAVVGYYAVLFAVSLIRCRAAAPATGTGVRPTASWPVIVLVVPARNEESVIQDSVRALAGIDYPRHVVMVVDDASTDDTAPILDRLERSIDNLVVLRRHPDVGGRGKGEALNAAYRAICALVEAGDPRLGADRSGILVGVVDADGRLDPGTLHAVAPYFADRRLGAVQIGVTIRNARQSLLARMQDVEFVGFSNLVQVARDRIGSIGLGGNGQFTRLVALDELAVATGGPWAPAALTEDLDLGLRMIQAGWRTRFCSAVFVQQEGLSALRPLMRQRTRWIQGHYQSWQHIPGLLRRGGHLLTRLDLCLYLVLVTIVVLVSVDLVLGLGAVRWHITNGFLAFLGRGVLYRAVALGVGIAPAALFLATYQRRGRHPFRWWQVPAAGLAFTLYTYIWAIATVRAWGRMAVGRWSWVKTPRVATPGASSARAEAP